VTHGAQRAADASPRPEAAEPRPQRADARRNRDLLLATAADLFEERGVEGAPLEELARRAHVGIGTLYRHFPNRDALVEAVYRREVELLCDSVPELLRDNPPDVALESWMHSFATYAARKRGLAVALRSMLGSNAELFADSRQRIHTAINTLVHAAVAAGTIRADVAPLDLLQAMGGICMAAESPGWGERTGQFVTLLMDGLRYRAPAAV
jgi:AcrR family transcriptional regulator